MLILLIILVTIFISFFIVFFIKKMKKIKAYKVFDYNQTLNVEENERFEQEQKKLETFTKYYFIICGAIIGVLLCCINHTSAINYVVSIFVGGSIGKGISLFICLIINKYVM